MAASPRPWQADTPCEQRLPLSPTTKLETRAVLKRCIAARTALAELKQAAELIPNPTVLINTLPLLKAKASSEIENIVTTTDLLFQPAQGGDSHADPATQEALRYRKALLHGYYSLAEGPLSSATTVGYCQFEAIHAFADGNGHTGRVLYKKCKSARKSASSIPD